MSGKIRRSNDVLSAPLDGAFLMMNISQGRYHNLNAVGVRIWELLEQPTTEEELVQTLIKEFEVSPEVCADHVAGFMKALRERGLLADIS